jgi:Tol biopolymer transport system component
MFRPPTLASPRRDGPPEPAVRAELAHILASDLFSRSERLSAFLKFVVEQTLDGHGHELKEQVLATELYSKGPDFSTAADPIVRVDARRLRDKLREYYASAPHHAVVISMPKGSYTPVFDANGIGASLVLDVATLPTVGEATVDMSARRRRSHLWLIAVASVLVGSSAWLVIGRRAASSALPFRLLTVTSFPGAEGMPSLSPDGNFVAYTWTGPVFSDTADVWVKAVDGDALRRITDTPQFHEALPSWSPDGRQIAFQRSEGTVSRGVYVVSPFGGPERKVVDIGGSPSWTPDSLALVMGGRTAAGVRAIFEHVVDTGERRQLTSPPPGFIDEFPKVSPDGTTLAFSRTSESLSRQAAVFVVPMANAEGREPERLTDWSQYVGRLDWTPDGREILYPRYASGGPRVFRIAVSGGRPPTAVPGIPFGINMLSVSRGRQAGTFRLAFSYGQVDVGLRLVDLQSATAEGTVANSIPFCDSTRMDMPGRFSRDGVNVAFTSDRGSSPEVWLAERTGASLRRVPSLQAAAVNVGAWSPDGRSVALDAAVEGASDIYVVSTDGGPPTRLTDGRAHAGDPDWSSDGRWIYYASDASGRSEIWKIRVDGGKATQITTDGGFEPREAPDGRRLFYVDAPHQNGLGRGSTLKQVSVDGGPASVALSGVPPGAWDVTDTGIVFLSGVPGPSQSSELADALQFYSFSDRRVRRIGALPFLVARFGASRLLSVSRDGRWALISHIDNWPRDIVVADNVR